MLGGGPIRVHNRGPVKGTAPPPPGRPGRGGSARRTTGSGAAPSCSRGRTASGAASPSSPASTPPIPWCARLDPFGEGGGGGARGAGRRGHGLLLPLLLLTETRAHEAVMGPKGRGREGDGTVGFMGRPPPSTKTRPWQQTPQRVGLPCTVTGARRPVPLAYSRPLARPFSFAHFRDKLKLYHLACYLPCKLSPREVLTVWVGNCQGVLASQSCHVHFRYLFPLSPFAHFPAPPRTYRTAGGSLQRQPHTPGTMPPRRPGANTFNDPL